LAADVIRVLPAGARMPKGGDTNGPFVFGTVTSNNGSVIMVGSQKVTTSASTKVWKTESASIHDVKVGETVQARGTESGSALQATNVAISPPGFEPGSGPGFTWKGGPGGPGRRGGPGGRGGPSEPPGPETGPSPA
jgi:hypothetical protein